MKLEKTRKNMEYEVKNYAKQDLAEDIIRHINETK